MTPLEDLLRQCTVKITVPGGWGTGFFVAPGLILTCAHVVRKAADLQVTVVYPARESPLSATVKAQADDGKTLDLALVELSEPLPDHPCVLLGEESVAIGQALYGYGYLESYTHAAPVRSVNEGLTGDTPPLLKLQGAQIEKGISGAALLNLKTGKVCGMVKETRAAGFDLGGGAIPTRVILEQFPELRQLQRQFHGGDPCGNGKAARRWVNLITQPGIDFQPYLQAILTNEDYREWQEVYTPTTVEDRRRISVQDTPNVSQRRFSSRLKLRAETVEIDKQEQDDRPGESSKPQEWVEQWDVLAGLRNYAVEHVVLVGKPGSGKSTALERLLWEEAEKALQDPKARIPVLVKLRRCTVTIEALIRDFLVGHQVALEIVQIEELLRQGRFLLLLDGLNELPKAFETELANFHDRYRRTTSMIVSTRDLSGGGTLGIEKTLKMLPLTEPQMRDFVRGYLGAEGDRLFQQLQGDRLRKFAETPLLLWMLCRVFAQNGKVPDNLGLAFREFAQLHDQELQADAPADSKDQWHKLLRHLAFVMVQGKTAIDPELSIPREEAEDCLTAYLRQEDRANPRGNAEQWLKDLLKYHLIQPVIQPNLEEHIEFRHQLIQEYYAAEYLLELLPNLTDEQLKQEYFNYLKWTEPISLMLALENKAAQALRVVKLALDDVDLMLGARLAGQVKPNLQATTIGWIDDLEIPLLLKVQCWKVSHSEVAISGLLKALEDSDSGVRRRVVEALGEIGSEAVILPLFQALKDKDSWVRATAIKALENIGNERVIWGFLEEFDRTGRWNEAVIAALVNLGSKTPVRLREAIENRLRETLEKSKFYARLSAVLALNQLGQEVNLEFINILEYGIALHLEHYESLERIMGKRSSLNSRFYHYADTEADERDRQLEKAFGQIDSDLATQILLEALTHQDFRVRGRAATLLGEHRNKLAVSGLLKALDDQDDYVRSYAARALGKIGDKEAIPGLIKALDDQQSSAYQEIAQTLALMGCELAIPILVKVLENSESKFGGWSAENSLRRVTDEKCIPELSKSLRNRNSSIQEISAEVLANIGTEAAILCLIEALQDQDPSVCSNAAYSLAKLRRKEAIPRLFEELEHQNSSVRSRAASALGNIRDEEVISRLTEILEDRDDAVRRSAIYSLAKLGSDKAIPGLIQELSKSDHHQNRSNAAKMLVKLGSNNAISRLIETLETSKPDVFINIVYGLEGLTNEGVVRVLIQALSSPYPKIHESAVKGLGTMGNPLPLANLWYWYLQRSGDHLWEAISAIQRNCKFYNYEIFQAHLAAQKVDRPASQTSDRNTITIQTLEKLTIMTDKSPIFNQQHATIGVNYAAEGSTIEFTQHTSSSEQTFEILLTDYQQFIQQLQQKYTTLADPTTVPQIIEVEAKLIEAQDQQRWQNFLNLKRLWNGGKKAGIKVGEHFAENNVWAKGAIAFLEGVSEDGK